MSSVVFFLKASPPSGLSLPADTKLVGLDPPSSCMCGGSDPRCSTAYSCLWQSLRDEQGRALPNLLTKYAPGATRVAFVAFSASHAFMNPLLNNAEDLAGTSAVILLDATFGGGKSGYQKAAHAAATGRMLLVSCTSDKGSKDSLNNGDYAWREFVWGPGDDSLARTVGARPPMPVPEEGVKRVGDLWYYRYSHAQLPHWEMGKLEKPVLEAHLFPYWRGERSGVSSGSSLFADWVKLSLAAAAAWGVYRVARGESVAPAIEAAVLPF